jgi:hypothetical protein
MQKRRIVDFVDQKFNCIIQKELVSLAPRASQPFKSGNDDKSASQLSQE